MYSYLSINAFPVLATQGTCAIANIPSLINYFAKVVELSTEDSGVPGVGGVSGVATDGLTLDPGLQQAFNQGVSPAAKRRN